MAISVLLFIACQTVPSYAQNDETSQPVLPIASPDQVEYRYDTAAGECRNADGKKGTNGRLLAPCGDLQHANLKEFDLRGKDLTGALLRGADLTGVRLDGAVLKNADLREASLIDANLSGADLTGATLAEAELFVVSHRFGNVGRLDADFVEPS